MIVEVLSLVGCAAVGFVCGMRINARRVRRLKHRVGVMHGRWVRTLQRFETAKEVIARMVEQESNEPRSHSSRVA